MNQEISTRAILVGATSHIVCASSARTLSANLATVSTSVRPVFVQEGNFGTTSGAMHTVSSCVASR